MDETPSTEMTLDQFLGHRTRDGGGGKYLSRWKQKQPPVVDVWLHTRATIVGLWQNPWPRIVSREDPQTKLVSKEVWGGSFNSWEVEDVLKKQYFRDKRTDERRYPPVICPMSLMLEEIRRLVRSGGLSWVAPLFKFVGDDPTKGRVLHAGGLYNGYRSDDLTREQKKELKDAGIFLSEAWKENAMAKCSYIFRVVDNDDADSGVQIATEGALLGERVQGEIGKAMTSLGDEAGHPLRNPYAIRWQHHPQELPQNKYSATRMERIQLTPQIAELIRETDPPPIDRMTKRGNVAALRSSMEHHYCGPEGALDWDKLFGRAEELEGEEAPDREEFDRPEPEPAPASAGQGAPVGEQVACDECRKPMGAKEMVCPHCGHNYGPAPAAQPAMRSRSEVSSEASPAAQQGGGGFGQVNPDDDIPF